MARLQLVHQRQMEHSGSCRPWLFEHELAAVVLGVLQRVSHGAGAAAAPSRRDQHAPQIGPICARRLPTSISISKFGVAFADPCVVDLHWRVTADLRPFFTPCACHGLSVA